MLARLAAWFLNTYVAEYVGNLNTDQLSIALLKGAVELEKLPLKKDAFRKLKLPITIKTGYIGKLKIEIPVTHIQSKTWVLHIDQVYLVAEPSKLAEYNEDEEEAESQERKQRKLKALEEQWKAEMQKGSWWNLLGIPTTFFANIVHNIQIQINDIHVRYEDEESCPELPFAIGITADSISVQTTNEEWEAMFVTGTSHQRKLFDCHNLALYWDTNLIGEVGTGMELLDVLRLAMPSPSSADSMMGASVIAGRRPSQYIVSPVNGKIRLTLNKMLHSLRSGDGPRLDVDIPLDDVSVSLTEYQYHSFLNLLDTMQLKVRAKKVAKWRPKTTIRESPAAWWRFAYKVALNKIRDQRKRCSWKYVLERAGQNVSYIRAYSQKITQQYVEEDARVLLQTLEQELSLDDLYLLRSVAMARIKNQMDKLQVPLSESSQQGNSFLERWLPGWSSSYLATESTEVQTTLSPSEKPVLQKQQSIKEEDEFLQSLGFEDKSQTFTRDRTFAKISFSLTKGSLKLTPSPKPSDPIGCDPILELGFESLSCNAQISPKIKETDFDLSLKSIKVEDSQNGDSLFPVLVQPRNGSENTSNDVTQPVLKVSVKREIIRHRPIWSIAASSKPLDIVLNSQTLHQLASFFTRKDRSGLPLDWTARVRRRLHELRGQTSAELRAKIEELLDVEAKSSRAKFQFDLDISAPRLLIPQSLADAEAPLVIIDLGRLVCHNQSTVLAAEEQVRNKAELSEEEEDDEEFLTPPSTPPSEEEADGDWSQPVDSDALEASLRSGRDNYDRYFIKLTDLQIVVAKAKERTVEIFQSPHSPLHLLDRFTLSVQFKRCLKFTSVQEKANKMISAELPILSFHLDEEKIKGLMECLKQLVPSANEESHVSQDKMDDAETSEVLFEDDLMYKSAFQSIVEESSQLEENVMLDSTLHSSFRRMKSKGRSELDDVFAKSVLFDIQFTIGKVSLTLSSRGKFRWIYEWEHEGRTALEVSIADMKAGAVKRPYDLKSCFIIGDLMIVDRIQLFGPEYEILACSSHRLLFSPESTIPGEQSSRSTLTSPSTLATKELFRNPIFCDQLVPQNQILVVKASQLEQHSPEHPDYNKKVTSVPFREIRIQCEGMDIMACSDTIAEMIAFLRRVLPEGEGPSIPLKKERQIKPNNVQPQKTQNSDSFQVVTEGSLEFGSLSIRIIRGRPKLTPQSVLTTEYDSCLKVASISANGLDIRVKVDPDTSVTAKLCGVEVRDLTFLSPTYPVICKVGQIVGEEIDIEGQPYDSAQAIMVEYCKPSQGISSDHLSVRVATIRYTHLAHFVREIQGFVSDFQSSLSNKSTLTGAAVGVARGLVRQMTQPPENMSVSNVSSFSSSHLSEAEGEQSSQNDASIHHEFDIQIATPVIFLPKSATSDQCIVCHLGQISISNCLIRPDDGMDPHNSTRNSNNTYEEITVKVSDVSMQAVNGFELSAYDPYQTLTCSTSEQQFYKIVREASASLSIKRGLLGQKIACPDFEPDLGQGWDAGFGFEDSASLPQYDFVIEGKVNESVSFELSKDILEQIKSTLRNLIKQPSNHTGPEAFHKKGGSSSSTVASSQMTLSGEPVSSGSKQIFTASFHLPKLSLQLEQKVENQVEKAFVFVVLQDFTAQISKSQSFKSDFDVKLGSIVIEDLLQKKDSRYRYIFLTSSKLLPSIMPSTLKQLFRTVLSPPPIASHMFTRPSASSSPRKPFQFESPLRAFSRNATTPGKVQRNEDGEGDGDGLFNSLKHPEHFINISAHLISEDAPDFSSKYNSVSWNVEAEFSSANVTINLPTWVLLLDFLGIGTPTPPPSPSPSPRGDLSGDAFTPQDGRPTEVPNSNKTNNRHSSLLINDELTYDAELFYSVKPPTTGRDSPLKIPPPMTSTPGKVASDSSVPTTPREGLHEDSLDSEPGDVWGNETKRRMNITARIHSLDVTFNKTDYPLARGTVSGLNVQINLKNGNIDAEGTLALISVVDLTSRGHYYKERFATTGQHALKFKVFKYGKPDPKLIRDFDFSVEVELGSVRYLHTMRFLKEVLAFCMHFPQLVDAFQRMKELARGTLDYEGPDRKPRISIKVDADEAYLLIPRHAEDPYLIVGDIGRFTVRNSFKFDGEEGTFSHRHSHGKVPSLAVERSLTVRTHTSVTGSMLREEVPNTASHRNSLFGHHSQKPMAPKGPCLLDCIDVKLMDVDVFTAKRMTLKGGTGELNYRIIREEGRVLKENSALDLCVERNLYENFCRSVPDLLVDGNLKSTHVMLDKLQLDLIKGLLDKNLGEYIEPFETPNAVIKDPIAQPSNPEDWTTFLFNIELMNVQLEFLQCRYSSDGVDEGEEREARTTSLARFFIEDSTFSFEAMFDQTKKVDFLNRLAVGYDTRYEDFEPIQRPNVHTEVIRPQFPQLQKEKRSIEVEIHVIISPSKINASILFHKVRITAVLDLLLELKSFVFDDVPEEDVPKELFEEGVIEDVDFSTELSLKDLEDSFITLVPPSPTLPSTNQIREAENKPSRVISVKLSVTETDIVLVEQLTKKDSSAVILKGTLVFNFRMDINKDKEIICHIQNLELFSCQLVNEEGTSLSILDPITAQLEVFYPVEKMRVKERDEKGCLKQPQEDSSKTEYVDAYVLQLELPDIKLKFSYCDIKMFVAIAQSLSRLKSQIQSSESSASSVRTSSLPGSTPRIPDASSPGQPVRPFKLGNIQVDVASVGVCIIDDCHSQNVPVVQLAFKKLQIKHFLKDVQEGALIATFAGDYFNRTISHWEPLVEDWIFKIKWKKHSQFHTEVDSNERSDLLDIAITSKNEFLVNVTSSLIHLIRVTHSNWSQDLFGSENQNESGSGIALPPKVSLPRGLAFLHSVSQFNQQTKRTAFVPYLLRNSTGLPLKFAQMASLPNVVVTVGSSPLSGNSTFLNPSRELSSPTGQSLIVTSLEETSEWRSVSPGEEVPFNFETKRNAIRKRSTSDLVVHQILVQVDGWKRITFPVSVDKVGVVFREIYPESYSEDHSDSSEASVTESLLDAPSRLVFAVSLNDAQKVINVRSPLVLHNLLEAPLEVRLESPYIVIPEGDTVLQRKNISGPEPFQIENGGHFAVPMDMLDWSIKVRPKSWGVKFSSKSVEWAQSNGFIGDCSSIGPEESFLYCVNVVREGYPPDTMATCLPAHTLTFYPPVTIINLLPCDMHFKSELLERTRFIRKGDKAPLYNIRPDKSTEFTISLDDFPVSESCKISYKTVGILQKLTLFDVLRRPLVLNVECVAKGGRAIEVLVSCPFWMINDTGVPLLFRQDHSQKEFANQLSEHEEASSHQPLLFSFSDVNQGDRCSVRLGKKTHTTGAPLWSSTFPIISGTESVRLFWKYGHDRPDREYQIGLDIHQCHGRMRHTKIVTFVACYKLVNKTLHEIAFLQRFQTFKEADLNRQGKIMSAKPNSTVTFHWPRFDQDRLLCIRLKDIPGNHWSGGFALTHSGSTCLNLRSDFGSSVFLRVEVITKEATSYVIFTEATNYPLPYRLENLSQVVLVCHQTAVHKENCQYLLNPGQMISYCWDEPEGEKEFEVQLADSKESLSFKPTKFGVLGFMYYENHIYLAAPATFPQSHTGPDLQHQPVPAGSRQRVWREQCQEMVMDVPQGTAVILQRKNATSKTQLWRMAAEGQLVHIATSKAHGQDMVLDIAGDYLPKRSVETVPLILRRRTNNSRLPTQTWKFSNDFIILKESPNLCAQVKMRYGTFGEGSDVVLGFMSKDPVLLDIQRLKPMRHTPGSGMLRVSLLSDGPTQVLRIKDENRKYTHMSPKELWLNMGKQESESYLPHQRSIVSTLGDEEELKEDKLDIEITADIVKGIGVSLMNSSPDELIFITFSGLKLEATILSTFQKLSLNVANVQVDNQLTGTNFPILLYPTPAAEEESDKPVIHISLQHTKHHLPGTQIFKCVKVQVEELTLMLDERILFRLIQWVKEGWQFKPPEEDLEEKEAFALIMKRSTAPFLGGDTQFHFDSIDVQKIALRVSMHTNSNLPQDLKRIRSSLVLPIVKFEAPILLDKYSQSHLSGTFQVILDSLKVHYKKVLRDQSLKIVGSLNFLGNPTGLVSDFASGVSGMMSQTPDVVGLVRDITHGVTDTASKLTGTASDFLGSATFDSTYQDEREQLSATSQTSSEHFTGGLIGLSSGLFGGITSIITQPYYGARQEGIGGFLTGLGKGVVGTFTKPVVGVLDFASGTSAAIRETTSRLSKVRPNPVRPKRCCVDPSGALMAYQFKMARAQMYLRLLTSGHKNEVLVAYEFLSRDGTRLLISTNLVYFITNTPPSQNDIKAMVPLEQLLHCRDTVSKVDREKAPLLVLSMRDKSDPGQSRHFKFRCDDETTARKAAQLINYAKTVHEYQKTVVQTYRLQTHNIW